MQQCKLIFLNDPRTFPTDRARTLYASSYLTGKAFDWVQPYLEVLENAAPDFLMNSWAVFEAQIVTLFGDPNELRATEHRINTLVMKETDHASNYIASFRALQSRLPGWGDRPLMFHF